ncbi:MAG: PilZ domain-containing protein [Pirellulaceae bacterium]|nr:PilZ domain-containing protein [Pirellulaceae bacterium]
MTLSLGNREPRYCVPDRDEHLRVMIESKNAQSCAVSASLVDLSCGGAKLRVNKKINTNTEMCLSIEAPQLRDTLEISAAICWTGVAVGSDWWLGCKFNPEMPLSTLQAFATAGAIERRMTQRLSTKIDISATYKMGNDLIPIRLTNVSSGGFCLQSSDPIIPNSRILLRIDLEENGSTRTKTILAQSRWQVATNENYTIGCEFSDPSSHFVIRNLHQSTIAANTRPLWQRLFRLGN